jgi:NAD(P)-dependent dehydrogenase (short-subunit alcohol dehydrogenase family)
MLFEEKNMAVDLDIAPLVMDRTGLQKDALRGDVALVTGGTSNIGLATVRSLAWLGAKVVIAARHADKGMATQALIEKENGPGSALFVPTDVSDAESVKNLADRAMSMFGKVDIVVNNAMDMSLAGHILKSSVEQLDRQYQVALRGAFLMVQAFVPHMQKRRHGVVTYISTTFRYPSGPSNYCALKAATQSMMMSLAAELGPVKDSGVAVFTYIPGLVARMRKPNADDKPLTFVVSPAMPGYPGPYPPEDCAAALAYSIVHSAEIHGSGIIIGQALNQMDWRWPRPETAPHQDYDRLREPLEVRMFGYLGPGFPNPKLPLVSINRSAAGSDEKWNTPVIK